MNESGTDLYERQIKQSDNDLMKKVWDGTPWMVDAHTGSIESDQYRETMQRCREQFGPEAWPIHGKPGDWQCGCVTIHGWTWMGFKTKEMMELFLEDWPLPEKD